MPKMRSISPESDLKQQFTYVREYRPSIRIMDCCIYKNEPNHYNEPV